MHDWKGHILMIGFIRLSCCPAVVVCAELELQIKAEKELFGTSGMACNIALVLLLMFRNRPPLALFAAAP
jgi:hypothetical protein